MRLLDLLQERLVVPRMRSRTKWDAIEELVDKLVEEHELRIFDRQEVLEALVAQERRHSTGLSQGLALPHARTSVLEDPIAVLGVAAEGIPFESVDGQDTQLICLLMIPDAQYGDHIKTIADITRLLSDAALRAQLVAAARTGDDREVLNVIKASEGPGFLAD